MSMNLLAVQTAILNYLKAEADFAVMHTIMPDVSDEPLSDTGYPEAYAVVRFNDANSTPLGGSFGGARHDEMYTLVDVLCIAPTPEEATDLAYGPDGIGDILTGYVPTPDAGEMRRSGGGQVFVRNDATNTKPTRYIAVVSFRVPVNMEIDEP